MLNSLEDAQQELINNIKPLAAETIPLLEAVGRISYSEILAHCHMPGELLSAVDGYALNPELPGNYDRLQVISQLKVGEVPSSPLLPGQAIGVKTGGLVPDETVTVIPQEKVLIKDNYLQALEVVQAGNNLKEAGEDYRQGDLLLSPASRITPGLIGLLAAFGQEQVQVYRRPRVAILSLGANVVPCSQQTARGEIRDANGPMLASMVKLDGGLISAVELAGRKNKSEIESQILQLLEHSDLLITTGGTYTDGINEIHLLIEELGARPLFREIPIQPGSHNGAFALDSRIVISLSGNPASCAVGYQLFVTPALRALQGIEPFLPQVKAMCSDNYSKKTKTRRFIRALASPQDNGWVVSILPGQKPSMIRSLVDCNALIDYPPGSPPLKAGSEVTVLLLDRTAVNQS